MLFGAFNYSMIPEREVGGGVFGGSLPSVATLLVCMPTDREGEHATFNSHGLDDGGGGEVPAAPYCQSWCFFMHTNGSGGRARGTFLFAPSAV